MYHPDCSYVVNNRITLQLETPYDQHEVKAKITHVFEPFTLSSVMVVLLDFLASMKLCLAVQTTVPCETSFLPYLVGGISG